MYLIIEITIVNSFQSSPEIADLSNLAFECSDISILTQVLDITLGLIRISSYFILNKYRAKSQVSYSYQMLYNWGQNRGHFYRINKFLSQRYWLMCFSRSLHQNIIFRIALVVLPIFFQIYPFKLHFRQLKLINETHRLDKLHQNWQMVMGWFFVFYFEGIWGFNTRMGNPISSEYP